MTFLVARYATGGLSPRSNVVFWDCDEDPGYARLEVPEEDGEAPALLASSSADPRDLGECLLEEIAGERPGESSVASADVSTLSLTDAEFAVLGQAADPDYDLIDLYADHLGSTRVTAADGGEILSQTTYLPFGETTRQPAEGWNTHLYTGHERDAGTGLDYMLARYSGGSLGRFLSVDPSTRGASLLRPQSINRYSYVIHNPQRYVDPDGREYIEVTHPFGEAMMRIRARNTVTGNAVLDLIAGQKGNPVKGSVNSGARYHIRNASKDILGQTYNRVPTPEEVEELGGVLYVPVTEEHRPDFYDGGIDLVVVYLGSPRGTGLEGIVTEAVFIELSVIHGTAHALWGPGCDLPDELEKRYIHEIVDQLILRDLLLHEMRDLNWWEKELVDKLPKPSDIFKSGVGKN